MNLPPIDLLTPHSEVLSVAELNQRVRKILEHNFPPLWVRGEISNFTRAASGHWYFSLKDDRAQVRCAMFRHRNQYVDWPPADGTAMEAYALVTVYEPKGDYQLIVEQIRRAGLGALFEAFEKLKRKLEAEGLFDAARKKLLPLFPKQVGVVTSPMAAALRDVLSILAERSPHVAVILYPTPVQGAGAADSIALAIDVASQRNECDVLIVCRGGGSIEDLWSFNDERVARAIARCRIPVISAVGHESDFTIADFVADIRAPTPSAAVQLAVPARAELLSQLQEADTRMKRAWLRRGQTWMQQLDHFARRLTHPKQRLAHQADRLELLGALLRSSWSRRFELYRSVTAARVARLSAGKPNIERLVALLAERRKALADTLRISLERLSAKLASLQQNLDHLNPSRVLERGYSLVQAPTGAVVRSSRQLAIGDRVRITFSEGRADAAVVKTDSESSAG